MRNPQGNLRQARRAEQWREDEQAFNQKAQKKAGFFDLPSQNAPQKTRYIRRKNLKARHGRVRMVPPSVETRLRQGENGVRMGSKKNRKGRKKNGQTYELSVNRLEPFPRERTPGEWSRSLKSRGGEKCTRQIPSVFQAKKENSGALQAQRGRELGGGAE